ncbi:LysR family transcriptional regulator [Brenneria tiliae]|uniref:LysR family transcriptional regulator n=1 Tax=Brenneria tiliae TaxID=2914984 RepID=UPI002014F5A3|nr:LysR family transcriptional regulator [Brenneria tiliae]MCL2896223.1 LysR family transcriptional regulator [Brenneria tiliae]MCL2900837.1 LysR family transcriptional regulator [Brenneria tiliae]
MEIRQLRAFVKLAECLSYREAADKLWLTQPTLTKQIKTFEDELELILFIRDNHGTQLSPHGQTLYDDAKKILEEIDRFKIRCKYMKQGKKGNLSIGFINSVSALIPDFISSFQDYYPEINIQLNDCSSPLQKEMLLSGKMQVGFMRLPVERPLAYKKIEQDRLAIIYNKKINLNKMKLLEAIKIYPLLTIDAKTCPGSAFQIHNFILKNKMDAISINYVNNVNSLIAMVESKIGIGILSQSNIPLNNSKIICEKLTGEYASWDIGLVWNNNINDLPRDNFIKVALDIFTQKPQLKLTLPDNYGV